MGHSRLHQRQPAADLARELGIPGQGRRLILPQIQVAPGQRLDVGRLRHGPTIAKPMILRRNIRVDPPGAIRLPWRT